MGSFSTKSSTKPWKEAQPYIIKGMQQTSQVFDQNQPMLQQMSMTAQDAFNAAAPSAFGSNSYVKNAQDRAQMISNGYYLGGNPGQGTYNQLQAAGRSSGNKGGMFGGAAATDPSTGLLNRIAGRPGSGAGDAVLSGLAHGGASNPADRYASGVAGGSYLNSQPSAGLYSTVMDADYLKGNPYLDRVIARTNADVTKRTNQMFGARGMGSGISSSFADLLSKNLADNEGQLRYQNYNDAAGRQLQAAGQSDAAWSSERGRMDASTGLLAANHNAAQDRSLSAAQALNQNGQQDAQTRLAAAQALGSQYNLRQDRALEAARSSDSSQQAQIQQMLAALGMTPDLRNAEYAGYAPALSLLNTAADVPYVGTAALNGQIREASNGYSTTKQSGGWGTQLLNSATQLGSAAIQKSDRRLKQNIEKIDELEDGLGIYDFDYVWGGPRQRGVMADEVEKLRPWALGPTTAEGYATVDYSAL